MDRYAVIGHPLGHSLSPRLHNWGYAQLGIDAEYEARPVTPDELPGFIAEVRAGVGSNAYLGLSVTIPHKQAVIPHLDERTWRAKRAGAVNTVSFEGDRLVGDNTDVAGIVEPVRRRGLAPERALILGARGAARAACAAMQELGAAAIIANRTRAKARAVAHDFAAEVADWNERAEVDADLVVNTTPLGMLGDNIARCPWPDAPLPKGATVFDLVYNPLATVLLRRAEAQGLAVIPGLEMFVHQGLEQFYIFTGRKPDPEAATALLRGALEADA